MGLKVHRDFAEVFAGAIESYCENFKINPDKNFDDITKIKKLPNNARSFYREESFGFNIRFPKKPFSQDRDIKIKPRAISDVIIGKIAKVIIIIIPKRRKGYQIFNGFL